MKKGDETKLKKLRNLIDTSCPVVYEGNWVMIANQGWRFLVNVHLTELNKCIKTVQDLQQRYGPTNVTMGHPIANDQSLQPKPEFGTGCFGIYVRDVDILIDELQKSLNDLEQIERWINA